MHVKRIHEETIELLMGKRVEADGHFYYDGTVSKILAEGGMRPKVMVRSGETDPKVIGKLGDGILGVPWRPEDDTIPFRLSLNLTPKKSGEDMSIDETNVNIILSLLQVHKRFRTTRS